MGDTPSSVDTSAFGFLTAVLRCPLPNDRLRRSMQSRPNLIRFCERISAAYFGGSEPILPAVTASPFAHKVLPWWAQEEEEPLKLPTTKETRTPKEQRFKKRSRNSVIGAIAAALLYVFLFFLIRRHTPFSPYVAPRFPHMSEMNSLFP